MLSKAIIYAAGTGVLLVGAFIALTTGTVFAVKRRKKQALISLALALLFSSAGVSVGIQFARKSFRAVGRLVEENTPNSTTPDTVANRKRFERHLGFPPDDSITQVYYYADEIGVDVRYQMSFKCNRERVDDIIRQLGLSPAPDPYGGLRPITGFTWWTEGATKDCELWVAESSKDYFRELWYSEERGVVLYQEYSL